MRLTQVMCVHNVKRWYDKKWAVQGNRRVIEWPVESLVSELSARGLNVVDVKKVAEPVVELPIVPVPEPWAPKPALDSTHPLWKNKICHSYDYNCKLLEGHKQAQLLSKTVIYEGLPQKIRDLVGVLDRPDQDRLVQRAILLSHQWDGWQLKLPKVIDKTRPNFSPPRSYGIPIVRSIKILVRNLIKLMESQAGDYEDAIHRTHLTGTRTIVTTFKDDDLIKFAVKAMILVTAKNALEPFATPDEVAATTNAEMPDLYPMKCTIDIPQTNIYEIQNFFPLSKTSVHPHLHTIYACQIERPPLWNKSQALNRGLLTCFTYAMARARLLYGDNVKTLPQPVTVQCVLTSQKDVALFAYQLNTLDLDSNDGIRNQAWIIPEMNFYERCAEVESVSVLEGYNPDAFRHLLAFHLNGLSATAKRAFPQPTASPKLAISGPADSTRAQP